MEKTRERIIMDMMHKRILEKHSLRERELLEIPWSLEELRGLCGKALRPAVIDSIERHAWKTEGVYRVVRIRKTEQREFIEELWILFDDDSKIMAHSTDSTNVMDLLDYISED